MLLSRHICVLVRNLFMENHVIYAIKFMAVVWCLILILVAEIAAARNRMLKSALSKQTSPVHQSR